MSEPEHRSKPGRNALGVMTRLASIPEDIAEQTVDAPQIHRLAVSVVAVRTTDGDIKGTSIIGHDTTRLKLIESQLIAAQKMEVVGRLASGVAHDFNNILAVIIGYADLLRGSMPAGGEMREDLEEILRAGERGAGLTRQLLAFSRSQVEPLAVLDLNSVVTGLDRLLRQVLGQDIELTLECDAQIGPVKADAGQMGQVLMNLVANARDAMPGGGTLRVMTSNQARSMSAPNDRASARTCPAGDYVMLAVTDSGTGIADDVRAHLFEPFFSTKPAGRGTGLGLATCQAIVAGSGGFVDVTSALGKGSTFSVYLPRVNEAVRDEAVVAPVDRSTAVLSKGNETLLVVEDEPSVQRLACTVLRARGYTVLSAANGHEGLRAAREHQGAPIKLVVTDVVMPVMGGPTMVAWLQTNLPDLCVLFTSGYTDDTIADLDMLGPRVEFLAKPYTLVTLTEKVRAMLDSAIGRNECPR